MTKFIDFYEVWLLPKSVARVANILEFTAATRLGINSKGLWMCLEVQQTKQLSHVAKFDLVWQLECNVGQTLSNHGEHVFLSAKDPECEPASRSNLICGLKKNLWTMYATRGHAVSC
ncbi:hypothetical protein TNCV_1191321 [Trichonephila clavipes]|nr:hypothetical protein TNCV_1191321 [Trichonephila clavipes]